MVCAWYTPCYPSTTQLAVSMHWSRAKIKTKKTKQNKNKAKQQQKNQRHNGLNQFPHLLWATMALHHQQWGFTKGKSSTYKFYADDELRKSSTLSSGSHNSTENWPILSSKLQKFSVSYNQPACCHCNCEWILGVSSLTLAWQLFVDSNPHALISAI